MVLGPAPPFQDGTQRRKGNKKRGGWGGGGVNIEIWAA